MVVASAAVVAEQYLVIIAHLRRVYIMLEVATRALLLEPQPRLLLRLAQTPHMVPEVIVPWGVLAHAAARVLAVPAEHATIPGPVIHKNTPITELPEMPIQGAQSGFLSVALYALGVPHL